MMSNSAFIKNVTQNIHKVEDVVVSKKVIKSKNLVTGDIPQNFLPDYGVDPSIHMCDTSEQVAFLIKCN